MDIAENIQIAKVNVPTVHKCFSLNKWAYSRLYNIKHFSLKTFGLMHFAVIDTLIMSHTEGFLIWVSLSAPSMTLLG